MPQTLYFRVLRRIPGENIPSPPKPYSPGIIVQYFQNIYISLGALNVRV